MFCVCLITWCCQSAIAIYIKPIYLSKPKPNVAEQLDNFMQNLYFKLWKWDSEGTDKWMFNDSVSSWESAPLQCRFPWNVKKSNLTGLLGREENEWLSDRHWTRYLSTISRKTGQFLVLNFFKLWFIWW